MKPTNLFLTLLLLTQSSLALASWEPYVVQGLVVGIASIFIYKTGKDIGKAEANRAEYEKGKKVGHARGYLKGWKSGHRHGKQDQLHDPLKHQQHELPISEQPLATIASHRYETRSKAKKALN